MKKFLSLLLVLLTLVLVFASCGGKAEKNIIGSWAQIGGSEAYTFNEDGSGKHKQALQNADITYEIEGDTITIHDKTLWVFNSTKEFTFEVDGDTLKLTDGDKTLTFARQTEE